MKQSFKHSEVFPLVHRIITDSTCKESNYTNHSDIVDALLLHAEGLQLVAAAQTTNKLGTRGTASNMVAWFSQRYSAGENQFAELLQREKIDGTWAYRSKQSTRTSTDSMSNGVPDIEAVAMEGNPKWVKHLKRERDPKMVKAKLAQVFAATGQLACECCGFEAKTIFPELNSPVVEVHHRSFLSSGAKETTLADLSILCPTCHRAIHRSDGLSVEAFKELYFPNLGTPNAGIALVD